MDITPKKLNRLLHCDFETGDLTWKPRGIDMFKDVRTMNAWNTMYAGKGALRCIGSHGYKKGRILGRDLLAHRVIWAMRNKRWPIGEIDHIDGDKLNNRLSNLREVTSSTNSMNSARSTRNTSGVTGVSFNKASKKWVAYIQSQGKFRHLGSFHTKQEAKLARLAAQQSSDFTVRHGT